MTYAAYLRIYQRGLPARGLPARGLPAGSGAAIDGAARGECGLAVAMYTRARSRWRAFAEFELAN
jgi:hypothetical protein